MLPLPKQLDQPTILMTIFRFNLAKRLEQSLIVLRTRHLTDLLIATLATTTIFWGTAISASNLITPYPDPDCGALPNKPTTNSFKTETQITSYNHEVDIYNHLMATYFDCVQKYLDNAAADIKIIREKSRLLIENTNAKVQ